MRSKVISSIVLLVAGATSVFAQFGKNHVQYKEFDTYYLQSEHFDIYFTKGGRSIAEFVAEVAEQSYQKIKKDYRYELVDRISFIVYNNHNDFEQTNVTLSPGDESTGGFTEFFKNRIVIPYEGDWEKFRHVIHHELAHAVMLQMMFGSGVQSIISGITRLPLPGWLVEGLAEYESRRWDTESDMFMRDAALNGYVPDIPYLNGFLAYKGGQSLLYYLSQKYGQEKVGELLSKIKISRNVERGFRQAIGIGLEDLSKRWHKYLKKEYWPDIAGREEPGEFSKQLTDHLHDRNFINNSPALSPKGDKIVFLSDRSDYFDIYLMSAIDGKILSKLVSGQTSGDLDELHWLRPGLTWSPDGKYIAFAAKSHGDDALNIVDVRRKKIIRRLKFGLDGVFGPSWSPAGHEIAFVGMANGQSDIYAVNLESGKLHKITDDVFTDLEPSFSPDGSRLTFMSDRGDYTDPARIPPDFDIINFDYRNYDIYIVENGEGNNPITRITNTVNSWEKSPVFSPDGTMLAYTSDLNGIQNIFLYKLDTGESWPITNSITGLSHLSWGGEGTKLAFTAFFYGGYDIFMMKNPLKVKPGDIELKKTNFLVKHPRGVDIFARTDGEAEEKQEEDEVEITKSDNDKFRNYVFGADFAQGEVKPPEEKVVFLDTTRYKDDTGNYKVYKYKPKFSPDIVYGNAGYSQFFGVQGTTQLAMSDIFGDHRVELYTDLYYDMRNSNYALRYFYLPKRTDYGIGAFHNVYFFFSGRLGLMRDRYFGANLFVSRPFDRYRRIDATVLWLGINRDYFDINFASKLRVFMTTLSYVKDTAVWGSTGPVNGTRSQFTISYSPKYDKTNGLDFLTIRGDYRRYFKFNKEYNFVVRLAGGLSEGQDPQLFFVGGMDNWLNLKFSGGIRIDRPEQIYFSSFETPLRGTNYYERVGSRFGLVNLEFRFPLIRYLQLGWPLPIGMVNIRGALFTDIGTAWTKGTKPRFWSSREDLGTPQLQDVLMGYGLGARVFVGFFLLRIDAAWSTDLITTSTKPAYYFSVGAEF